MNIEDTGGTHRQATAVVHLAQSTPESFRRATWLCYDHLTVDPVPEGIDNAAGVAVAPDRPGIGATVDTDALGDPVAVHEEQT